MSMRCQLKNGRGLAPVATPVPTLMSPTTRNAAIGKHKDYNTDDTELTKHKEHSKHTDTELAKNKEHMHQT